MSDHTPGKLECDDYGDIYISTSEQTAGRCAGTVEPGLALRLVACWNACEGLDTALLEQALVLGTRVNAQVFEDARALAKLAREAIAQCNYIRLSDEERALLERWEK